MGRRVGGGEEVVALEPCLKLCKATNHASAICLINLLSTRRHPVMGIVAAAGYNA